MPFNFQQAFDQEKAKFRGAQLAIADIKKQRFTESLKNVTATIQDMYDSGIPRELESPVADWLEQFYEHGCVWMNEDLKRLADLWLNR